MEIPNHFAWLAVAGVLLWAAIGQYLRALKLAVLLDEQAQEIEDLKWQSELAHEKCLSWERKYRRGLEVGGGYSQLKINNRS